MRHFQHLAALVIAALSSSMVCAEPATRGRAWTLEDILTIPKVTDLVLGAKTGSALYIVRSADLTINQLRSTLYRYERGTASAQKLIAAPDIEQLSREPGTTNFTALMDLGHGLQLYRMDEIGRTTPLLVNEHPALVGHACGAISPNREAAPQSIGVLSYDWSPDGKWLWYVALKPKAPVATLYDQDVEAMEWTRCLPGDADVELHIRGHDGSDRLVATRPTKDRAAFYFGGNVEWQGSHVVYRIETGDPDGQNRAETISYDLINQINAPSRLPADDSIEGVAKPIDARFETIGYGFTRNLIEHRADGSTEVRGKVNYTLGDARAAGHWKSSNGETVILGVRMLDEPRYALARIGRRHQQLIGDHDSLTKCDFASDLSEGICIREGMSTPPELVAVHPASGHVDRLLAVSPQHEEIAPLRVTPKAWTNRLGYAAQGFIVWPRGYQAGHPYPAIMVTHGSDADQRFAAHDFQWEYPIQYFAEQGYIVIAINDPAVGQSAEMRAAWDSWGAAKPLVSPADMRRSMYLNGVYSFEDALKEMIAAGQVDPARVGIAGFSRGSQMTEVTMTQSHMFRAASSGDGNFLDPAEWWPGRSVYLSLFGGSPYGSDIEAYRQLSPHLRADSSSGAILQQVAGITAGAIHLHRALAAARVPSQITFYPGEGPASNETHVFHIPANRLNAMRENVAWFDFWLRNKDVSKMAVPERLEAWKAMRAVDSTRSTNQP